MANGSVWWERHPERLELEEAALADAGYPYEVDQERKSEGTLVMKVRPTIDGRTFDLVVTFPDLYPYFQPQVVAPEEDFPRHQSPGGGVLCLLGRESVHWNPEKTLAEHLREQVPRLLEAVEKQGTAASAELEITQGEPYSFYYQYASPSFLLVDSSWKLPEGRGTLRVGYKPPLPRARNGGPPVAVLRGAVLEVFDEQGRRVAVAPPEWRDTYTQDVTDMPWVRVEEPIRATDVEGFIKELPPDLQAVPNQAFKNVTTEGRNGGKCKLHVTAVVFPEELQWQEESDGWVFLVRHHGRGPSYLARAYRYGRGDFYQRIPELRLLENKRVLVVGTGGLGGPAILELARCGVGELRIVDDDSVDPATTVRWPVGLTAAGATKVHVLASFVRANYPYTKVAPTTMRLGAVKEGESNQYEALQQLLADIDLVLDASAEFAVHHVLSDLAAERGIPFVYVNGTQGGWGGVAARIDPSQGAGCWRCLQHRLYDDVSREIADAPSDPSGGIQAHGCGDITFTAAGFDMATLSLTSVRLAVATLCRGNTPGYPDVPWDIQVTSLRTEEGTPTFEALTYPMKPHPDCCGEP